MDSVEQNKVGAKANIGSKRKLRKTRHDALRKVNIQAATQGYEKGILNKKDGKLNKIPSRSLDNKVQQMCIMSN